MGKMELGKQKVEDLINFLDKKQLVGQEVEYQITGGKSVNGQDCIELTENDKQPVLLGLSRKIKEELILRYGDDPSNWLGQFINVKFTEYKPKPGQKNMNEGVTAEIVSEVEAVDMTV